MQNEEVGLARVEPEQGGLSAAPAARQRKSRKESQSLTKLEKKLVVDASKDCRNDAVLSAIAEALEADQEDRSAFQVELLSKASAFLREVAAAVAAEKRNLDSLDNQLIAELDKSQREALERISNSFTAQYSSYNSVIKSLNTMPDDVSAILDEAFGGQSPNY
jgi:hypothetical protein